MDDEEDWDETKEETDNEDDYADEEEQDSETEEDSIDSEEDEVFSKRELERLPKDIASNVKEIRKSLTEWEKRIVKKVGYDQSILPPTYFVKQNVKTICEEYEKSLEDAEQKIQEKDDRIHGLEDETKRLREKPIELKKQVKDLEEQLNDRKKQIGELIQQYSGYGQEEYEKIKQEPKKHGSGMKVNDFTVVKFLLDNGKSTFTQICNGTGMNPKIINDCRKSLLLLGFIKKNENGSYEATQAGKEAVLNFQGKI